MESEHSINNFEEQKKNLIEKLKGDVEKIENFTEKEFTIGAEKIEIIYHKFKERDRADSFLGAIFNMVQATVGAGTLSMPFILLTCGVFIGVPLIILGAIIGLITLKYLHTSIYLLKKKRS
jgi:hypothetical protein